MRDTSFPFSQFLLRRSKRPRKRKQRRDKTREEPDRAGRARQQEVVQNYEVVKRHVLNVARCRWPTPSRDAGDLELGQTARKKRSVKRDEARSSAAIKRARHLSRTCVLLVTRAPFLLSPSSFISCFCSLSNRSRITVEFYDFLPEMFIYVETLLTRQRLDSISTDFEMKFYIVENVHMLFHRMHSNARTVLKIFFRILDFSTFFFVICFTIWILCFFCYTYICILSLSIFITLILLYSVIKNFIKFIYLFFYIIIFLYFYLFNMIMRAKIKYVILEARMLLYLSSFLYQIFTSLGRKNYIVDQ